MIAEWYILQLMRWGKEGLSYPIADRISATACDQLKVSTYQQPKERLSYTVGSKISPEQQAKLHNIVIAPKETPPPVSHQERITSTVHAIFDRFSPHVLRDDIRDELILGKSLLIAQKKNGVISEIHMEERSDGTERNYLSQDMTILFEPKKQPRVELTEVGLEYTSITLEYGHVDQVGDISVNDNVVIRSNYWGDGSGISNDGISMYSFSKESTHFLSGIELSMTQDQQRNELVVKDDPYVEGGVRFPLRKINIFDALQGFEEQLAAGGTHTKGIFNL